MVYRLRSTRCPAASRILSGHPSDPVDARAHSGQVQGTANMLTLVDGRSPIMNMGLVTSTNRHTAFDVQLVVDALKLTPANPSFLNARDAILRALDNKRAAGQLTQSEHTEARRGIWTAFAKFGMGHRASSNGPSLSGVIGNFELPPDPDQAGIGIGIHVEAMPIGLDAGPAGPRGPIHTGKLGVASHRPGGTEHW